MVKAIIFDFFDVIHSDPFKRWLRKNGFQREGKFEEVSRLTDLGHISEAEFYERLSALSGQPIKSIHAEFGQTHLINDSMVQLIRRLKPHYKLGLLSNSSSEYLRPILAKHDLVHLFDEIVISAEVGLVKPDPEIFRFMVQSLHVTAEETVLIDDNLLNVEAAAETGIRSHLYTGNIENLKNELEGLGIKF